MDFRAAATRLSNRRFSTTFAPPLTGDQDNQNPSSVTLYQGHYSDSISQQGKGDSGVSSRISNRYDAFRLHRVFEHQDGPQFKYQNS